MNDRKRVPDALIALLFSFVGRFLDGVVNVSNPMLDSPFVWKPGVKLKK